MHERMLGAVLVGLLYGCSPMPMHPGPSSSMAAHVCSGAGQCRCQVTVNCPAGQSCAAVAQWTTMELRGHVARWEIATPGYSFDPGKEGIEFKTQAGKDRFNCHPAGAAFLCTSRQPDDKTYEYRINLVGPQPVPAADPFVVNN